MIRAHRPQAVRDAEAALPDLLESGELMQRAAKGVARIARARLRERGGRSVVALVGPGNNGADALWAIARLAKKGARATAVCHDVDGSEAQTAAAAKARARGAVVLAGDDETALEAIGDADLVLDGITGLGGRPGLPPFARPWVDAIGEDAYVLAVDTPSGQPVDGGPVEADAVFADECVTFGVPRPLHLLPPTEAACGLLTVVDIGLDVDGEAAVEALTDDDVARTWPVPTAGDDKYSRGVLGVVAGGEDYTGAPLLTVTTAVDAGVGMVRYVGTPTPEGLVRASVPEAVHGQGRVQAWVIGPGLDVRSRSKGASAQMRVARDALASDLPVLLDAGGLDLVTGRRDAPTLLTPHAGECARLLTRLGDEEVVREQVDAEPVAAARRLADLTGASVLLKGATTVVLDPGDGPVRVASAAPAWLATAGSGDVLSGLVGTLLAGGLAPLDAGSLGAHVHGRAAAQANPGGPLRALAVAQQIPRTVAALL